MITTWMVSAVLFAMLLGIAAHCAEIALRAAGRQARWAWLAALSASVTWPVLATLLRRTIPDNGAVHTFAARIPTLYVVPDPMPTSVPWAHRLDVLVLVLWAAATLVMLARLGRGLRLLSRVRRAASSRVVDGVPVLSRLG